MTLIMRSAYPYTIKEGYVRVNGQALHRKVMEEKLGRKLKSTEIVHHIDYNRQNNSPENLQLVSCGEHLKLHKSWDVHDFPAEKLSDGLKLINRVECTDVWIMEKERGTKKGIKKYQYYILSFRVNGKVKNVHIGSVKKLTKEEAINKAKEIKSKLLSIGSI